MGGGHAVTFAVHFCDQPYMNMPLSGLTINNGEVRHTRRPFLLDQPLQEKIQELTPKLPNAHEHDLGFAGGPYQGRVDDAESLGHEGEPGAEVGYWVVGILVIVLVHLLRCRGLGHCT